MKKPSLTEVLRHPIVRALNPQRKQFLRRVILPSSFNPFGEFRMSALLAFGEFTHIKSVPAFQMLYKDFLADLYVDKHTIVVDSSGNTAHAVARLAPAFGFANVVVVMSADVPAQKRSIFAALSTPTIISVPKGRSVAEVARELGERPGHYHLNQYAHPGNMQAHDLYTGPEVERVCGGNLGIIAIALGSGGTAAGIGRYLSNRHSHAQVLGVRPKLGEQVPGARDSKKMAEVVRLPWEKYVNATIDVSRKESFEAMRRLGNEAVEPTPGPTSGLAFAGLLKYLRHIEESTPHLLELLTGKEVAFICPDSSALYSDVIIAELDSDQGLE